MRYLVLTRGTPASGKSTWIKDNNLEQYTLEPDKIRLMVQSPKLTIEGKETISQKNDTKVWNLLFDMLEERMKRGEFTVIDATHSRTQLINKYRELCKKYRYRVVVIDFSDTSLETILLQNRNRDEYKFVPEEHIKTVHERLKDDKPGSWCKTIKPNEFKDILDIKYNLSEYKSIKVIGDVHGCYDALVETIGEFNKETFYIFLGDLFDRGIQNVITFEYMENLIGNRNVLMLEGNHDRHLRTYLLRDKEETLEDIKLPNATKKTIQSFLKCDINDKRIRKFYEKYAQLAYFEFHGTDYICTHGGISNLPTIFTATDEFVYGTGKYEDSETVDEAFDKNTIYNTFSIHGHRNIFNVECFNTSSTINLNGKPEFGGKLLSIDITKNNQKINKVKQNVFNRNLNKKLKEEAKQIDYSNIYESFKHNKYIQVKDLEDDIKSINFTKNVFHNRIWNDITCKARGLFIREDDSIVARSYNKFFNYKELDETTDDSLRRNLKYPINIYEKENGYLGILSVDLVTDEWFISSKSTNKGPYADMFKQLVQPYLTDELKESIKVNNISLVFEVNHLCDPHIIKYETSHIVLLDIVYNTYEFKKYSYKDLCIFGEKFNFYYKEIYTTLDNYKELYDFIKYEKNRSVFEEDIEGYVVEDSNGFTFKLKGNYYNFWKRMRSLKDTIYKSKKHKNEVKAKLHKYEEFKVCNFMYKLKEDGIDLNKMNIIEVRELFEKEEIR